MVKVRSRPSIFSEKNKLFEAIEVSIETLIPRLNLYSVPEFIDILSKYSKVNPACKTIENAYIVLLICMILQEKSEYTSTSKKSTNLESLAKIFTLHKSKLKLTSKCLTFEKVQEILNKSTKIVSKKLEILKEVPELFYCFQLLQVFTSISFEIACKTLSKITRKVRKSSIFSFFTNDSIPVLPANISQKKTLVLDLDETLGHFDGRNFHMRPGARDFIKKTSEKYELVLFTSAKEIYANAALELIDPSKHIIFRLYRQHLLMDLGVMVKDLRVLGRDLEKVLIIDNEKKNFRNQIANGIQIKTWTGDQVDLELYKISDLLCSESDSSAFEIVAKVNSIINQTL